MTTPTTKLRISPYIAFEASGSSISDTDANSGYSDELVAELERIGTRGGTITLSATALRDLAEWCDALEHAAAQGGNPSGARSLRLLAERCIALAAELER